MAICRPQPVVSRRPQLAASQKGNLLWCHWLAPWPFNRSIKKHYCCIVVEPLTLQQCEVGGFVCAVYVCVRAWKIWGVVGAERYYYLFYFVENEKKPSDKPRNLCTPLSFFFAPTNRSPINGPYQCPNFGCFSMSFTAVLLYLWLYYSHEKFKAHVHDAYIHTYIHIT